MAKEKTKIKKKQWIEIIAPKIFKEYSLCEITTLEPKSIIGRTVKVSLMELIGNTKKQNTVIEFKITKLEDNKAKTEIIGYKVAPSSIKRFVRRGREKVENSMDFVTSDKKSIRVKSFAVTRSKTNNSVLTNLNRGLVELLKREIAKVNLEQLFSLVISNKLQEQIKSNLAKIYPLKIFLIREMKLKGDADAKTSD